MLVETKHFKLEYPLGNKFSLLTSSTKHILKSYDPTVILQSNFSLNTTRRGINLDSRRSNHNNQSIGSINKRISN